MVLRWLLLCLALSLAPAAFAGGRFALVIGNDAYREVAPLKKAVPDAEAMAAKLGSLGFEVVLATDVGRRAFNLAVAEFTSRLAPGDTAVVFYAGHGVEIEGENYLLPTDIVAPAATRPGLVVSESIALSALLERVRRTGARATLAFIDACRDNPFATTAGRSIGGARGLARIAAPEGTFVVYSAGAGQQALDRLDDGDEDPNSVFTRNLLPRLSEPGLELRDLVAELRIEVRDLARTRDHAQFPAYYDELLGEFYFAPGRGLTVEEVPAEVPAADDMARDFELARAVGTAAALRAFLERYGAREDAFTVTLARRMLSEMEDAADAADEPEATPAADAAREVMRASQVELNRLGCNAGGADGIAGRRTRTAFAAFLAASETGLTARDLGTERALAVLRRAKAPACRAGQPAVSGADLAGRWSFKASCPMFITTTGTVSYRQTGDGRYAMSWTDSIGGGGSGVTVLTGLRFETDTRVGPTPVHESGTLAADGRSYRLTNTLGCTVTAWR